MLLISAYLPFLVYTAGKKVPTPFVLLSTSVNAGTMPSTIGDCRHVNVPVPFLAWHQDFLVRLAGPGGRLPSNASEKYTDYMLRYLVGQESWFKLVTREALVLYSPAAAEDLGLNFGESVPNITSEVRSRTYEVTTAGRISGAKFSSFNVFCAIDAGTLIRSRN